MNSMQDRLTGALDAAAQTVRPQTLRPLREPRRARRGRWDARFAPAAAAIGVALVVAVALVVTSGQQRTTGSGPASGLSAAPAAIAPTAPPRYYAEAEGQLYQASSQVVVRSIATGAVVARIANPPDATGNAAQYAVYVAAAPGDQTFYAVYESGNNDGGIRIYRFQLDSSGAPSALIEVAGGLITGQNHLLNVGAFAVSPDGSQLAVAAAADPASGDPQEIVVVNLRSGAQSIWHGGLARTGSAFGITDLSWTGDGKSLVYLAQWCQTQHSGEAMIGLTCNANSTDAQVRELNVASGGGRLDSGPVLLQPSQARRYIGQALINPAGTEIAAVVQAAPGAALEVAEISVATGKTVSVLYRMADPGPADFEIPHLTADSSGQYLLFGTGGSGPHHGWIKDGTLHKLPPLVPSTNPGDWEGFAW
jgi:hypothetical protein